MPDNDEQMFIAYWQQVSGKGEDFDWLEDIPDDEFNAFYGAVGSDKSVAQNSPDELD